MKNKSRTVSIDGETLMNYLMKRFNKTKKQAIDSMKKHNMDTSFINKNKEK